MPGAKAISGKRLFTFVAVADTHVNEAEQLSTSPYETNHLANARARYVFAEIAAMDPPPAFVVHLGDIVHPMPALPAYHDAAEHFQRIASQLSVPLHLIPGNHDVGDKTVDWMPAELVCDAYLDTYRDLFGEDFYAFDHGAVRFVMVNALLFNSDLADEQRQRDWLAQTVDSAGSLRVFVFMHYPPYVYRADERGSYDNIDEPGRGWLLAQLAKPQVEAIFAGHVHNFWYDQVGSAELYMLPSSAFLRHDYSEFATVAPACEFGRADVAKFGIFRIDVHEHGHVAYLLRSYGRRCAPGEHRDIPRRYLAHPKTSGFGSVGVELRHPWAEVRQITATGGVQEFGRKWARNDYPLLALWEMGVRLAKVPDADIIEDEPRARMRMLAAIGHRHVVTVTGVPHPELMDAAAGLGVSAYEANLTLARFHERRAALRAARAHCGGAIYFAKILCDHDAHFDGKTFNHFVQSGFTVEELPDYKTLDSEAVAHGDIDGITVRVDAGTVLTRIASALQTFREVTAAALLVSIKLAGAGAATARTDDRETAARAAEAMVLSRAQDGIRYVFDTFMDVDRGYYPRHAFIDRHFNPRLPARVFAIMNSLLPGGEGFSELSVHGNALHFHTAAGRRCLVSGERDTVLAILKAVPATAIAHDLLAGDTVTAATAGDRMADEIQALLVEKH